MGIDTVGIFVSHSIIMPDTSGPAQFAYYHFQVNFTFQHCRHKHTFCGDDQYKLAGRSECVEEIKLDELNRFYGGSKDQCGN